MRLTPFVLAFAFTGLLAPMVACGGKIEPAETSADDAGVDTGRRDGGHDAGADSAVDAGADVEVPYPAPHPAPPTLVSAGGRVLTAPVIHPIFFSNDSFQGDGERLSRNLWNSKYWSATTAEYGVGPIATTPSVVLRSAAPTAITDTQIQGFLRSNLGAGKALGPVDPQAIYTLFYPASTTVTLDIEGSVSVSCQEFGGYHNSTSVDGTSFAYAVLPRCEGQQGFSTLDLLTTGLTHELIEAATDPEPLTLPAYNQTDAAHLIWQLMPGGEATDLCNYESEAFYTDPEIGYMVARSWSNLSAAAGHDPCVPAINAPYFNTVPVLPDAIDVGGGTSTDGVRVPLGETVTIDLKLFSDAPIGPWDVYAVEPSGVSGELDLQIVGASSGKNGDTLKLQITRNADGAFGGTEFALISVLGDRQRTWFGLASN